MRLASRWIEDGNAATLNHGTTPYLRVGLARRGAVHDLMPNRRCRSGYGHVHQLRTYGKGYLRNRARGLKGSNEHVDFGDHDKRRIHILHGPLQNRYIVRWRGSSTIQDIQGTPPKVYRPALKSAIISPDKITVSERMKLYATSSMMLPQSTGSQEVSSKAS